MFCPKLRCVSSYGREQLQNTSNNFTERHRNDIVSDQGAILEKDLGCT